MKKFIGEFKAFILRGNVVDLAIAVLVGAAFQSVITSFTDNLVSPLIGIFLRSNFDELTANVMGVSFGYGAFITALINFVITGFILFLIVKAANRLMPKKAAPPPASVKTCPFCKSDVKEEASRCPFCTSEL